MYPIYVNKSIYVNMLQTLKFTFWFIIVTVLSKGYYRKNKGVIHRDCFRTSLPQIEIGDVTSPQIEIGYSTHPPN